MKDSAEAPDEAWIDLAVASWGQRALALMVGCAAEPLVVLGPSGEVRFGNPAAQQLLGHASGTLLGTSAFDLVHPDDHSAVFALLGDVGSAAVPTGIRLRDETGDYRAIEATVVDLTGVPDVGGLVVSLRDRTAESAAESALHASEVRFRELAENVTDFIFRYRIDPPGFDYASPAASTLTGHDLASMLADQSIVEEILGDGTFEELVGLEWAAQPTRTIEFPLRRADGSAGWVQLRATVQVDARGRVEWVDGIVRDITDRHHVEVELQRRALHDQLTGLANRALFYDRLEHALRRADRLPGSPAVLFCDLDGFKAVNDELGHAAGDALLIHVGQRLAERVRPGDTVARLGGDEFLVLCDDIAGDDVLDGIVDRLRHAVTEPLVVAGTEVRLGVSVGAARADASSTADELVHRADLAMYADKSAPRAHRRSSNRSSEPGATAGGRRWNDPT